MAVTLKEVRAQREEVRAQREEVAKLKIAQEEAFNKWLETKNSLEVANNEYSIALKLLVDYGKKFALDEGENCTQEKLSLPDIVT